MDFKVRETIDIDIIGSEKSKHLNETIYLLLDFDYDENISIFGNQSLESVRENLSEITNIDSNLETIQEEQQNFEKTIEEGLIKRDESNNNNDYNKNSSSTQEKSRLSNAYPNLIQADDHEVLNVSRIKRFKKNIKTLIKHIKLIFTRFIRSVSKLK